MPLAIWSGKTPPVICAGVMPTGRLPPLPSVVTVPSLHPALPPLHLLQHLHQLLHPLHLLLAPLRLLHQLLLLLLPHPLHPPLHPHQLLPPRLPTLLTRFLTLTNPLSNQKARPSWTTWLAKSKASTWKS